MPQDQPSIQAGIDFAVDGDTVLVDSGLFVERLMLRDKNVLVASHLLLFPNDTSFITNTIIHADSSVLGAADTGSVVTCVGAHDTTTALFGFTLTGGIGLLTTEGNRSGGGVYSESDLALLHCRLHGNTADLGGAVTVVNAINAVIRGCRIDSNVSNSGGPLHFFRDNLDPDLVISQTIVVNNSTSSQSSFLRGSLQIDSCRIEDQGFQLVSRNRVTITRSRLERCPMGTSLILTLEDDTLVASPVTLLDPQLVARRTFFHESPITGLNDVPVSMDSCFYEGSLTLIGSYPVEIRRSTLISENGAALRLLQATRAAGAAQVPPQFSLLTLEQTLVVTAGDPAVEVSYDVAPDIRIQCSDVFGSSGPWISHTSTPVWDTALVYFEDPRFCDPHVGDYSLQFPSICLPAQSTCGQIGVLPLGCGGGMLNELRVQNEVQDHVIDHEPVLVWFQEVPFVQDSFEIEVGSDSDWTVVEHWQPGPQAGTESSVAYSGAALADGETYQARVRASSGSVWSDWVSAVFRLNSMPAFPVPLWPPDNGLSELNPPLLQAAVGPDVQGDSQQLQFVIWDSALSLVEESALLPDDGSLSGDTVSWTGLVPLQENAKYYWSVRASDGFEMTGYGPQWTFHVDAVKEPPLAGAHTAPVDDSIVYSSHPHFQWRAASDPDPLETLSYLLQISSDSLFPDTISLPSADTHLVSPISLPTAQRLWWRVQALDGDGLENTSQPTSFLVYLPGDVNGSWTITTADIITLVNHVFKGQPLLVPECAGRCNGDETITTADVIWLINIVFRGGLPAVAGCD